MAKTIVVNCTPEETRMAILEDGGLTEVSVERSEAGTVVGNIYKGRVKNVLPGMQAAFIDIGQAKNAFLYLGDETSQPPPAATGLTEGREVLVQIVKDAIGTKGPRATTHLTLPGRYVVLMPTVDYVGISRRIADEAERERLKAAAEAVRPPGMGIIIRTLAEGKSGEELAKDVAYLINLWNALQARAKISGAPSLLYRDVDLVIRIVRDYLSDEVTEFVLDQKEAYNRVCDLLRYTSPEMLPRIQLYQGSYDVFTHYGLDTELDKIGQRSIWLKCGGYIVIDRTEALTVIDVNTGRFVGNTNLSDTVFRTNLDAVVEIARQIRLRDIGGIIIIDFIDMDQPEQQEAILDALAEQLKKDRTKSHVLGFTALGLVELTRKKARQSVEGVLYCECPHCQGRGRVQSPQTVIIKIVRAIRSIMRQPKAARSLLLQVHPQVAEQLQRQDIPGQLERELGCQIRVEAQPTLQAELYSILQQSVN